jgi:hypothetical protein
MQIGGLAVLLAGCSADTSMFRSNWNWWSNSAPVVLRAAPPEGLVGPDGACAGDANQPRGIALGMTECDLIRVAGPTNEIAIGANERGERTAVLTYPQGERAGIYRFASGLLVTIERLPEAAAPQRAPRKPKPKPKPQAQTRAPTAN